MAIGREIKDKIKSIANTKKITQAMEMVAASKMRKSQERMLATQPYAENIRRVIGHVARAHAEFEHPFMAKRKIKNVGYIIVTTDRGLCGGLNNNLLKLAMKSVKQAMDENIGVQFCLIGNKAMGFFKKVGGEVLAHQKHLGDKPKVTDVIGLVKVMLDAYLEKQIDAIYICSNHFISAMRQESTIEQLFPLIPSEDVKMKRHWDYIYEPDDAPYLLNILLTRYAESQVFRSVVENIACEQAARMVAMRNATENAGELIANLRLIYNKARQAAITRELSEIVAGASVIERETT